MAQIPGFHRAELDTQSLLSPTTNSGLYGVEDAELVQEEQDGNKGIVGEGGMTTAADRDSDRHFVVENSGAADEARHPAMPRNPGRPTRIEWEEHQLLHWPYRSWCKHCVRGKAHASPHKTKSEQEREERRDSGIPTISYDHCFMGSADSEAATAHESPWLVCYDDESEAINVIAVPSKSPAPWICQYEMCVLEELGYKGSRVCIKIDGAKDLQKLRSEITMMRSAPTVPIDVATR